MDQTVGTSEQNNGLGSKLKVFVKTVLSRFGLWVVLFVLIIIAMILSPRFASMRNITNILRQVSILGVLAVGMTFVILSGGIDLSVGAVMALSCVMVPVVGARVGDTIPIIVVACLTAGIVMGAITGVIVSVGKLQPFIATLGMSAVAEGIGFILSDGRPIILEDMRWVEFGGGYTAGFPNLALLFIGVIIIGQFILSKSVFGVYVYAIGNNEEALRLSGVQTRFVKMSVFIISGMLAALGGLMMTARISVGDPGVGTGYSLDVISAVVVGGTRMGGGYGSVINTLLGTAIIGILNNVFNLMGISPYPQMVFKGVIIIAAVLIEQVRKSRA